MDEATSNIDVQTEQIIQKLIKEEFKESTTITIAHRLHTIMNSDGVLVMDKGQVAEFDSPENLLKDSNGIFSKLIEEMKEKKSD